jgi:hypothetical protein
MKRRDALLGLMALPVVAAPALAQSKGDFSRATISAEPIGFLPIPNARGPNGERLCVPLHAIIEGDPS